MLQVLTDADVERLTAQGLGEIGLAAFLEERVKRAREILPHAMGRVDALVLASDNVPETLRRFTAGNEACGRYVKMFEESRAAARERLMAEHPAIAEEALNDLSTAMALTVIAHEVVDQAKTLLGGALNAAINDVKDLKGEVALVEAQVEKLQERTREANLPRDGVAPPP